MEQKRMTLSEKLKYLRSRACMTQDDIAEVLKMNRTSFSKYENGASTPPLAVLRKLAKIYSVPLEYLIHDEQPFYVLNESTAEDVEREKNLTVFDFAQLTAEERLLIMKLRLITDEQKRVIMNSIEEFVEE